MNILRLIFRAFIRKKPRVRVTIIHEKLPSPDRSELSAAPISRPTPVLRLVPTPVTQEPPRVTINGSCFVIDGDTIMIGDARIRLAGIDAPELDHPYGKNAKWALVKLCKGQSISAVLEGGMSHDRTVATCYLPDGRDLSAEMVKLGLAIDWPKFSGGKYRALEVPDIRRKLWRCDARQKGLMPPPSV